MSARWIFMLVVLVEFAGYMVLPAQAGKKESPAKVEAIPGEETPRVTLSAQADQRLGVEVVQFEKGQEAPSSALLYDVRGGLWVYYRESDHSYRRIRINGGKLKTGGLVVTRGAAELFGTESGVGK